MTDEWFESVATERPGPRREIDTSVAHIARVYDYLLGGKDNFAADREAAGRLVAAFPGIVSLARANRAFLGRAVRYLAADAGIRQFLDIGTGIPAANNTHQVAQEVAPECRVVYVDNDPVVLAHARALLTSGPGGVTSYLDADLREVPAILERAAATLDFSQPVAVMLVAILHYIPDSDDPGGIVARLVDAVPPGSYLTISHAASDIDAAAVAEATRNYHGAETVTPRTRARMLEFFDGLDLVQPGVARVAEWRPATEAEANAPAAGWAAVGRKP